MEEVDFEDDEEPKTISFDPKTFDDITRTSVNYGHDEFVRGNVLNDSTTRESLR